LSSANEGFAKAGAQGEFRGWRAVLHFSRFIVFGQIECD
jgi:hypothetical protein